jgi:hypothetical protein
VTQTAAVAVLVEKLHQLEVIQQIQKNTMVLLGQREELIPLIAVGGQLAGCRNTNGSCSWWRRRTSRTKYLQLKLYLMSMMVLLG